MYNFKIINEIMSINGMDCNHFDQMLELKVSPIFEKLTKK